ncbi:jg25598 [Pararge aegeria aegeria]|uniref:Jg25598 protein n=1 Tax=Pararge aegeria aegeria TaxID=348720 RepID=A0A8S4RFC0_9NEOP|nr:jg25598 [Pararge aegeria aegeria]
MSQATGGSKFNDRFLNVLLTSQSLKQSQMSYIMVLVDLLFDCCGSLGQLFGLIKERLSSNVQIGILKFFGHIVRNKNSMERLVVQESVEGKRLRARSPTRRADLIKAPTPNLYSPIAKTLKTVTSGGARENGLSPTTTIVKSERLRRRDLIILVSLISV